MECSNSGKNDVVIASKERSIVGSMGIEHIYMKGGKDIWTHQPS